LVLLGPRKKIEQTGFEVMPSSSSNDRRGA